MDFLGFLKTVEPRFREKQLRQAVFKEYKTDFDQMFTISKGDREKWANDIQVMPFTIKDRQESADGSIKWLLENQTKNPVETVLMHFKDGRNTVCISSQSGCAGKCAFCATGKLGFKCNLTAWEIVAQVILAANYLKNNQTSRDKHQTNSKSQITDENNHITNIVFMGMGEPLLNLNNVLNAIAVLTDPEGFGLGARHITVSTSGPIDNLQNFINAKTRTTLAISLHAPNQFMRDKLMPMARANQMDRLINLLDQYVNDENGRRVTYEYIMLKNVNDRLKDAHELGQLLKGRLAHVNLISFNPVPGVDFQPSEKYAIDNFKDIVQSYGVTVTKRVSLGDEITAACGQLAGR